MSTENQLFQGIHKRKLTIVVVSKDLWRVERMMQDRSRARLKRVNLACELVIGKNKISCFWFFVFGFL